MGLRFYRRFRILPGVSVNVSKSGTSVTMGPRGAHVTVGRRGVRETVGIPGTGISYTTTQGRRRGYSESSGHHGLLMALAIFAALMVIHLLSLAR